MLDLKPLYHALALASLGFLLGGCAANSPAPIQTKRTTATAPIKIHSSHQQRAAVPGYHVVARGDTLHAIAWRYRLDFRDLSRWNSLRNPDLIRVGQKLRLSAPKSNTASAAKPSADKRSNARTPKEKTATTTKSKATSKAESSAPQSRKKAPEARSPRWTWPAAGTIKVAKRASGAQGIEIRGSRGQPVKAAAGGTVVYSGSGLRGYGELIIVKHNETYLSAYAHNEKRSVEEGSKVKPGEQIAVMGDTEAREVMLHFEIRRNGKTVDPLQYLPKR